MEMAQQALLAQVMRRLITLEFQLSDRAKDVTEAKALLAAALRLSEPQDKPINACEVGKEVRHVGQ